MVSVKYEYPLINEQSKFDLQNDQNFMSLELNYFSHIMS